MGVGGVVRVCERVHLARPAGLARPGFVDAPRYPSTACAIYLVLSDASVSTQRAFIMSAVVFATILFDRAAISFRSFVIAMVVLFGLRPESVVTPGFQMSFAATAGLIAMYEVWSRRREWQSGTWARISFAMKSLVVTSFVGAAATAPFALLHFDQVAGMGLLVNLLAKPIVTFVRAPAAALSLLLAPFGLSDFGAGAVWPVTQVDPGDRP